MANEHDGNWNVLIFGLDLADPAMSLGSGLAVRELKGRLNLFGVMALAAAGFREAGAIEPFLPYCFCELESAKDAEVVPGPEALGRAWLVIALLVLRGHKLAIGIAASAYSWSLAFTDGTGPVKIPTLPEFRGSLLDLHLKTPCLRDQKIKKLTKEDAEWIAASLSSVSDIFERSEKFRFALQAAVDWRYSVDERTALARIWSGIEAYFGVASELSYRLSLFSACLLEPRGLQRKRRFHEIRKLYDLRSKSVHGESVDRTKLQLAVQDSFALLSDLLIKSIATGRDIQPADVEDAVFH